MNACHLLAVVGILLLPVASPAAPADSLHASPAAGLYPAAPSERHNPLPTRVGSLRNLALRRQTTASSQYDYNLTPQLITDGIRATAPLPWLTVTTPEGALPARERERLLDGRDYTRITLRGDSTFCTLLWRGMDVSVNAVRFTCRMVYDGIVAVRKHIGNTPELDKAMKAVTSAYVSDSRWPPLPTTPGRFNVRESIDDLFAANKFLGEAMEKGGIAEKRAIYSAPLMETQIKLIEKELMDQKYFGE